MKLNLEKLAAERKKRKAEWYLRCNTDTGEIVIRWFRRVTWNTYKTRDYPLEDYLLRE